MNKIKKLFVALILLVSFVFSAVFRIFAVENIIEPQKDKIIEVQNFDELNSGVRHEILNGKKIIGKFVKNSKNNVKFLVKNTTREGVQYWIVFFVASMYLYVAIKIANNQLSPYMLLDDRGFCRQFDKYMLNFIKNICSTNSPPFVDMSLKN